MMILRDRVVRAFDKAGKFRLAAVKNTRSAQTAASRHRLPVIPSFLLARQMAATTMLASFLKTEERIIIETESDNAIRKIYTEAMQNGEIRGYVNYIPSIDEAEFTAIEDLFGAGLFRVSKILSDRTEPVSGMVPIMKGDISTDLAYYFRQSEQIPTAVILDVVSDDDGIITQSGGILIQALPGATEEDIERVYEKISSGISISELLEKEYTPDKILREIMPFDLEIIGSLPTDFYCRCSKDNFLKKLMTLGYKELADMKAQGQNELVCQYCNEKYLIEPAEFDTLLTEIAAKKN